MAHDDDDLGAVPLPPASTRHGQPGHDQAMEYANGARLLALRASGFTYPQIAKETGYADGHNARDALLRALARHEAANATELRAIENEAYDADIRVLRRIITDPNAKPETRIAAINARTRAAARHARMNGLDAPQQIAVTAATQVELEQLLATFTTDVLGEVIDVHDEPGTWHERAEG
jgi:hypothetical protein